MASKRVGNISPPSVHRPAAPVLSAGHRSAVARVNGTVIGTWRASLLLNILFVAAIRHDPGSLLIAKLLKQKPILS